jgi:hypothetical protein
MIKACSVYFAVTPDNTAKIICPFSIFYYNMMCFDRQKCDILWICKIMFRNCSEYIDTIKKFNLASLENPVNSICSNPTDGKNPG